MISFRFLYLFRIRSLESLKKELVLSLMYQVKLVSITFKVLVIFLLLLSNTHKFNRVSSLFWSSVTFLITIPLPSSQIFENVVIVIFKIYFTKPSFSSLIQSVFSFCRCVILFSDVFWAFPASEPQSPLTTTVTVISGNHHGCLPLSFIIPKHFMITLSNETTTMWIMVSRSALFQNIKQSA